MLLNDFYEKYNTLLEEINKQANKTGFGAKNIEACYDKLKVYQDLANHTVNLQKVSKTLFYDFS